VYIERRAHNDNFFSELQDSSLKKIQERSGNIWTDYNVHDPGITIMEHLHYALLELQYINDFSFADYLKNTDEQGNIDYSSFGLFPAEKLFAPSIVTPSDYEKWIVNYSEEIEACRVSLSDNRRYIISLQAREGTAKEKLKEEIEAFYHANRNLCETLEEVRFVDLLSEKKGELSENEVPILDPDRKQPRLHYRLSPSYSSIQNDFPDNYGINRRGKPTRITEEHEARILQLKGYLLIYDYMMQNTYRQVNNIPRLLSFSDNISQETITDIDIENINDLIDQERKTVNPLQDEKWLYRQKARYLDGLDSLYGENTDGPFRMELIRLFPEWNTNRFRSFNILDTSIDNIPVVKRMIATILNYDLSAETSVVDLYSRYNLQLLSDKEFFSQYKNLLHTEYLSEDPEHNAERIERNDRPYNERRFWHFHRQLNLLWHHVLFESFLQYGSDPRYYRMIWQEDRKGYLLLYKHPGMQWWLNMGFFFEKETLINVANDLWEFISRLSQCNGSFYMVEHILLTATGEKTKLPDDIHTLSVVLPSWNKHFRKRNRYERLIRERLPAHLDIRFLRVNTEEMYRFEQLYFAWRKVLPGKNPKEINKHGQALRHFIYNPSQSEE